MSHANPRAALTAPVANLREEAALALVRQRLDLDADPPLIVKDCQGGLRQVGLLYEQQEYYSWQA